MKKLILVAALAVVAVVVAPITSASAVERFSGTCYVQGKAKFVPDIGLGLTSATYKFSKGAAGAKTFAAEAECEGTAVNAAGTVEFGKFSEWNVKVAVVAGGKGELECGVNSEDGKLDREFKGAEAKIELEKGLNKFPFKSYFRFTAAKNAGELVAELNSKKGGGGNTAVGRANFKEPGNEAEKAAVVAKCAAKEAEELPFETASEPVLGEVQSLGIWGTIGE
jgi:hypothetical protein